MSKSNDDKILSLKERIKDREKTMESLNKRYDPKTTLMVIMPNGEKRNIRVMDIETLSSLYIWVKMFNKQASELTGLCDNLKIFGQNSKDLEEDIKAFIDKKMYGEEKAKLKSAQNKLTSMLSDDKQTEIELNNIAKLLGL